MGTQAEYMGGSKRLTISADQKLTRLLPGGAWTWHITADANATYAVQLPDARTLIPGYPVIQIVNESANTFAIEDFDGTELVATGDVTNGTVWTFALFDNSTAAGDWEHGEYTQQAGSPPTPTIFPWTLGGAQSNMDNNAFRYDFVAETWTEPGGTSTRQMNAAAGFESGGIGYMCSDTSLESYNPTAWATLTARDVTSLENNGAKHDSDDKGYVFGTSKLADDADEYDVSGDSWTAITDHPEFIWWKGVAQNGGAATLLLHGGAFTGGTGNHNAVTTTYLYDITADSYSTRGASTFNRLHCAHSLDRFGDLWRYAGAQNGGFTPVTTDDVEKYDKSADSWSTETDFPTGNNEGGGATFIAANRFIYVIGGTGGSNDDSTYRHDPASDTYLAETDHLAATTVAGLGAGNVMSLTD